MTAISAFATRAGFATGLSVPALVLLAFALAIKAAVPSGFMLASSGDRFLTEGQMRDTARHVDGPFRYERIDGANHWLQLHAPEQFNPLLLDCLR